MKAAPAIEVVGADANNLQNVGATFPRGALTAVVGVSGSGKSSFVEQTLAVEGAQRMRRFMNIELPLSDATAPRAFVNALPPMLFAGQHAFRASSRTTLATCTGMMRVVRRLFARFSAPYADEVEAPVPDASAAVFAEWLSKYATGPAIVWAVPVLNEATDGTTAVARLKAIGVETFSLRSETDRGAAAERGRQMPVARFKPLRPDVKHTIEAIVCKLQLEKAKLAELRDSLERAWRAAPGAVFVELPKLDRAELRGAYSYGLDARIHRVHPKSERVYAVPNQHLLSFNAPEHPQSGACPICRGLGVATEINEDALVIHPTRSLHRGAFALWTEKNYRYVNIQHETIEGLRGRDGFDPDRPWSKLPDQAKRLILDGSDIPVEDRDLKTGKKASLPHAFLGFRRAIMERAGRATPAGSALQAYVFQGPCRACGGSRWSSQARALRFCGWSLDRLLGLSMLELRRETTQGSPIALEAPKEAKALVSQLHRMASSLVDVGLGHLSGDRGMLDVSSGESRRVRLAGVLGSRLAGLVLVLDEPARGLHELDLMGLGAALREATRLHTVVISEHRQRLVAGVDHIIELGPGAGPAGGRITYSGPVKGTAWVEHSDVKPAAAADSRNQRWLEIRGVEIHNLKGVNVRLPFGKLSCIAGVSGSGKSSFVRGALVPALAEALPAEALEVEDFQTRRGKWLDVCGVENAGSLHALDQSPAAAQKRSLVATFLEIADVLRRFFASQQAAKRLELEAKDFGTNSGRGRCQRCLGLGVLEHGIDCPVCGGLRFNVDVLSVRVGDLNMADLLAMPLADLHAIELPKELQFPVLASVVELGIGYLSLGRSLDTLSGGELQRLRIARALAKPRAEGALFVLDEPAGGLHPKDVAQLLKALRHMLADGRNSVIVVEHDPHVLAACDHIVEFGPGGGPDGGQVIAAGSPAEVRKAKTPTGLALRDKAPAAVETGSARQLITRLAAPTRETAMRARAELRQIAGEDVEVPEADDQLASPAALVQDPQAPLRPHEVAGLDIELASVLLDSRAADSAEALGELTQAWNQNPRLRLQVHPLLDALALWGCRVPRSTIAEVNAHLAAMGLGPSLGPEADVRRSRVTGSRFAPREDSASGRDAALRDAWALGSGFVELVDAKQRVVARACDRLMDLEAGFVGPRHPDPRHFTRFDQLGACPMCSGSGSVSTLDERLVIRKASARVLDESSMTSEAATITKGLRRAEMVPFFQRLAKEGLWNERATWNALDDAEHATVMHGFWIRPGHGTFLKVGAKNDGSEVNHWLRWDGLVAAIVSQLPRARDAAWAEKVRASQKHATCRTCEGTGLGTPARLLMLGERSLQTWTRRGSVHELLGALGALRSLPPRAKRRLARISECLKPLKSSDSRMNCPVPDAQRSLVLEQATKWFTGMQLCPE